jgi:nucleoside-diphosphate-sugar epimerase
MIVGNGDIASVLPDRDDFIWFASGVSNSQETRSSECTREKDLLFTFADERDKRLIYFSTLSVFYKDSPYTRHKKKMEQYVKMFPKYCIVRLGNITWGTNPHTIINHFRLQKARGQHLEIQDTSRYVVDQDEFLHWLNLIPDFNCEMNIPGTRMTIQQIINTYINGNQ